MRAGKYDAVRPNEDIIANYDVLGKFFVGHSASMTIVIRVSKNLCSRSDGYTFTNSYVPVTDIDKAACAQVRVRSHP